MDKDLNVVALSDDDIDEHRRRYFGKADPQKLSDLFDEFGREINHLVLMVKRRTTDISELVQIERVVRLMGICPPDEKFLRVKDKVFAVREHILNKNAAYFLNKDYSGLIKKDSKQAFIESLVETIKNTYDELTDKEKEMYWDKGLKILRLVIEYRLLVGDAGFTADMGLDK
jgi:hypothetical protein